MFLGLAAHIVGASPMPSALDSQALQATAEHVDVSFVAKVIDDSAARDGRPLLRVEMQDGYQTAIYVADDSQVSDSSIAIGSSYRFRATTMAPGLLIMNKPGSVVRQHTYLELGAVRVNVTNQVAYLKGSMGTYQIQAPGSPDGLVIGRLVEINGVTKFLFQKEG